MSDRTLLVPDINGRYAIPIAWPGDEGPVQGAGELHNRIVRGVLPRLVERGHSAILRGMARSDIVPYDQYAQIADDTIEFAVSEGLLDLRQGLRMRVLFDELLRAAGCVVESSNSRAAIDVSMRKLPDMVTVCCQAADAPEPWREALVALCQDFPTAESDDLVAELRGRFEHLGDTDDPLAEERIAAAIDVAKHSSELWSQLRAESGEGETEGNQNLGTVAMDLGYAAAFFSLGLAGVVAGGLASAVVAAAPPEAFE